MDGVRIPLPAGGEDTAICDARERDYNGEKRQQEVNLLGDPTNPNSNYQISASLAAGAEGVLTTPELPGKRLSGVDVWSSLAFKALLYTVDNSVQSTNPKGVGGSDGLRPWNFRPPHPAYVALGATAGLDAFRVRVTNLDTSRSADVHALFYFEDPL